MGRFTPVFEGELPPGSAPEDFLDEIARRAGENRLLPLTPAFRNRYRVAGRDGNRIRVVADSFQSALAVGLNDITLERRDDGSVHYRVSYYRWMQYCLFMCLPALLVLGVPLFVPEAAEWARQTPAGALAVGAYVVLFTLGWPFALAAMQKPAARRVLLRALNEACVSGGAASDGRVWPVPAGHARSFEYKSAATFLGLPLVHVAVGPKDGRPRSVARGVIAVGDVAFGLAFAAGGMAVGGVAVGGVAAGLVAVGGCAAGGLAVGGCAVGGVAVGGLAAGGLANGGLAVGHYANGGLAAGVHATGGSVIPLGK